MARKKRKNNGNNTPEQRSSAASPAPAPAAAAAAAAPAPEPEPEPEPAAAAEPEPEPEAAAAAEVVEEHHEEPHEEEHVEEHHEEEQLQSSEDHVEEQPHEEESSSEMDGSASMEEPSGHEEQPQSEEPSQEQHQPEPEQEQEAQPQPEPQPEAQPEPQPQPEAQPKPQPQPEAQPEPQPQSEAQPQPQPQVEPEPQPKPQPQAEPEPQPKPLPQPQPQPEQQQQQQQHISQHPSPVMKPLPQLPQGKLYPSLQQQQPTQPQKPAVQQSAVQQPQRIVLRGRAPREAHDSAASAAAGDGGSGSSSGGIVAFVSNWWWSGSKKDTAKSDSGNGDNVQSSLESVVFATFDSVRFMGRDVPVLIVGYDSNRVQVWNVENLNDVNLMYYYHHLPIRVGRILHFNDPRYEDVILSYITSGPENKIRFSCLNRTGNIRCSCDCDGGMAYLDLRSNGNVLCLATVKGLRLIPLSSPEQLYDIKVENTVFIPYACPSSVNAGAFALGPRWLAYASLEHATFTPERPGFVAQTSDVVMGATGVAATALVRGITTGASYVSDWLGDQSSTESTTPTHPTAGVGKPGDGSIALFDTATRKHFALFHGHDNPLAALTWDRSGTMLVSSDIRGHEFQVFKVFGSSVQCVYSLYRGITDGDVRSLSVSVDSKFVAAATSRGTVHLYPLADNNAHEKYQSISAVGRFRHTLSTQTASTQANTTGAFSITTCFDSCVRPSCLLVQTNAGNLYIYKMKQDGNGTLDHQFDITPVKGEAAFKVSPPIGDQKPFSDRRQFLPNNVDLVTSKSRMPIWRDNKFCFAHFDNWDDPFVSEVSHVSVVNVRRPSVIPQGPQGEQVRPTIQQLPPQPQPIPRQQIPQNPLPQPIRQPQPQPLPQPQPQVVEPQPQPQPQPQPLPPPARQPRRQPQQQQPQQQQRPQNNNGGGGGGGSYEDIERLLE